MFLAVRAIALWINEKLFWLALDALLSVKVLY